VHHDGQSGSTAGHRPGLNDSAYIGLKFDRPAKSQHAGWRQGGAQMGDDAGGKFVVRQFSERRTPGDHFTPQYPPPGRAILVRLCH
jgi:hypothetical protein